MRRGGGERRGEERRGDNRRKIEGNRRKKSKRRKQTKAQEGMKTNAHHGHVIGNARVVIHVNTKWMKDIVTE